jgi:uncharacterized protein YkwD
MIACAPDATSSTTRGANVTGPGGSAGTLPQAAAGGAGTALSPAQMTVPVSTSPMHPPPSAAGTGGASAALTAGIGAAGSAPPTKPPVGGAAGSGAATTSTTPTGTTTPAALSSCAAPPSGSSDKAIQAWTTLNQTRLAAGVGCMNMVTALNTSALAHCNYNAANAKNQTCTSDPHGEMMSCTGFTGATAQAREVAAGYPQALAYTEVATTFGNNPVAAVPGWIDTVWHRIPLLDPWTVDMGYGGAVGCDVIDIGRGMSTVPANTVVVYPYNGQTDVPPTFSGLEGPAPPPPPDGWPSAYPISIYAQRLSVTEHVLTKDGDNTPIDHLWLDANSSQVSSGLKGYFTDTAFLYGAPFELSTKYHVKIVGTHTGGALNAEWTFTTAAKRPFGT